MAELVTVPTFTFQQGSVAKADSDYESPIRVEFYNGSISLRQEGEYDVEEVINIHPKYFEKLFKEIKKHMPDAMGILNRS